MTPPGALLGNVTTPCLLPRGSPPSLPWVGRVLPLAPGPAANMGIKSAVGIRTASSSPVLVLLERAALNVWTAFSSPSGCRFHGCSQLGVEERAAGVPLRRGASGLAQLIPGGAVCQVERNWPAAGFINVSFLLPPARCCAKIPHRAVISLKPRGA